MTFRQLTQHFDSGIFAVGAVLFLITLCFTVVGNRVLSKFREAYE